MIFQSKPSVDVWLKQQTMDSSKFVTQPNFESS